MPVGKYFCLLRVVIIRACPGALYLIWVRGGIEDTFQVPLAGYHFTCIIHFSSTFVCCNVRW